MNFHSTEQAVSWFRDRYVDGQLVLKPPFQRQPVWTERQKNFLIESVLLKLPIPELYAQHIVTVDAERETESSTYAVVDGQQRIRSILQFIGVDQDATEAEYNKFALDKLPAASPFHGATYSKLSPEQKSEFLKYRFSVRELETSDDDQVRDIFKRLNKYSTKLNDQELRNATFTGPFMQLSVQLADREEWITNRLVSPAQIRRMKDIEFVSELIIGAIHGPQGGSARAIDAYYQMYEEYEDEFPNQNTIRSRFESALATVQVILGGDQWSRFRSNRTDYYSLFVATASFLRSPGSRMKQSSLATLQRSLHRFEAQVDQRLGDEATRVSKSVVQYVRSVEKGANDKNRRGERHQILLTLLGNYFKT